jgi:ribokinase
MRAMGKVTVVGSYIVALVMDTDRLPVEGETVVGWNYHTTHGGKGSNMAVCAARLGADSTFMGKIGRDAFGKGFISLLKREGVNPKGVLFSDQLPTAVGMIIFTAKGANAIVIDRGANGSFLPEDVLAHKEIIESADAVVSPLEIPLETALAAAKIAKAKGARFILNPAPAVDLRAHDLGAVFALTPNEVEGRICVGLRPEDFIDDRALAQELLNLGAENVMLTLGAKGVIWASREGLHRVPALKVKVVDSVGAGDAFNAGLATGLSENLPLRESVALGVVAASLSTQKRETIDSYPRRAEVIGVLEEVLREVD